MDWFRFLGWFGNIFIVLGLWSVGDKKRYAFLFSIVGETIWVIYAVLLGLWDLAFACVLFDALAIRNWIKWGKP
jgi:hypothetical protein